MNIYHDEMHVGDRSVKSLLYQVFGWVALAVGLSGLAAYVASGVPAFHKPSVFIGLFIVQLLLIILVGGTLATLSARMVQALFLTYSVVTGLSLASIFLVYSLGSVVQIFFVSAGMFAGMALYGFYTRSDLSQYRSLLYMMIWGLILCMVVNIFWGNSRFDMLISVIGVLVFAALTAFDIQRIKILAGYLLERDENWHKSAVVCALQLYLDFLNLFLSMLRLFGRRES